MADTAVASARMTDEFYDPAAPHLPPEPPRVDPHAGRLWSATPAGTG